MSHYTLRGRIHLVIYRRHVIRVRESVGVSSTDIFREIINSGNGDVAIKVGIYPSTPTRSRRKKKAIGNLRFIGRGVSLLLPIYISSS